MDDFRKLTELHPGKVLRPGERHRKKACQSNRQAFSLSAFGASWGKVDPVFRNERCATFQREHRTQKGSPPLGPML